MEVKDKFVKWNDEREEKLVLLEFKVTFSRIRAMFLFCVYLLQWGHYDCPLARKGRKQRNIKSIKIKYQRCTAVAKSFPSGS